LKPKRTPYEIIWEILDYCTIQKRLTHIIQGCNLNTYSARKYIDLLIRKGLITKDKDFYKTTEKGLKYLSLIKEIYREIFKE